MSEGVAIAHSYTVCYKFLLTDTKRYFPTLDSIGEEKDFFAILQASLQVLQKNYMKI